MNINTFNLRYQIIKQIKYLFQSWVIVNNIFKFNINNSVFKQNFIKDITNKTRTGNFMRK